MNVTMRRKPGPAPRVLNPVRSTILLTQEASDWLDDEAHRTGRNRSQIVNELIDTQRSG